MNRADALKGGSDGVSENNYQFSINRWLLRSNLFFYLMVLTPPGSIRLIENPKIVYLGSIGASF